MSINRLPLGRRKLVFVLLCFVLALQATWALEFSASALRSDIAYLASDECQGRMTGTPGCERAANYIAARFSDAGLQPVTGTDHRQPFTATTGFQRGPGNALTWNGRVMAIPTEAAPPRFSCSGSVRAPVVFAGYGITAPGSGRDDYAGLDVRGKIALVISGEPGTDSSASALDPYTPSRRKVEFASRAGAVAVLYLRCVENSPEDQVVPFDAPGQPLSSDIPLMSVTRAAALEVLPAEYADVLAESPGAVESRLGEVVGEATVTTDIATTTVSSENVVGLLSGSDERLRWEYVVVGAHYDHVGYRGAEPPAPEDIYNGADDNASGTAAVMALARAFSTEVPRPRRSLVFACFAGEELGLLGSRHYVAKPPVPLESTVAMLNFDMVGRLRADRLYAFGTETSPAFGDRIAPLAAQHGLDVVTAGGAPYGSDHASFISAGVPSVFLFTGVQPDYHTPADDWWLVDAEGVARVVSFAYDLVRAIADSPERPEFVPPGEGGRREARAFMGVFPETQASAEDGYVVSAVSPGGPAAQAGIQSGDVIARVGDTDIRGPDDLVLALSERRPGDTVRVVVHRGGNKLELDVRLGARR